MKPVLFIWLMSPSASPVDPNAPPEYSPLNKIQYEQLARLIKAGQPVP
jgi:hypothetical protein